MKRFSDLLAESPMPGRPSAAPAKPAMPGKPAAEKSSDSDREITWHEINQLEKHLDAIWKHLGIDIDFTKHFVERVNDPRNKKQITIAELQKIFTEVAKKYGKLIASKVTPESEKVFDSVLTDLSTKVNTPVIVHWDKKDKELKMLAKTVMRVNHFYTHADQPRLTVENMIIKDGIRKEESHDQVMAKHGYEHISSTQGHVKHKYKHPTKKHVMIIDPQHRKFEHRPLPGKKGLTGGEGDLWDMGKYLKNFQESTNMKTYSDLKEWVGFNTPEVAPMTTTQAVDDVDTAAHSVEHDDVLDKLNAYCQSLTHQQYMNPYYPLHTLWRKLSLIGINFNLKALMLIGDSGHVSVPLTQFGGRYGILDLENDPLGLGHDHGYVQQDDGISHRLPGGLKLTVAFVKTGGVYSLSAKIEHGTSALHGVHEEFNQHSDCGSCGTQSVWTNDKGVCSNCVDNAQKPGKIFFDKRADERQAKTAARKAEVDAWTEKTKNKPYTIKKK